MDQRIEQMGLEWVDEVECLLRALGFLVEVFVEEDAVEVAYRKSVAHHWEILQVFKSWLSGEAAAGTLPVSPMVRFAGFSEATARAMAPLVETILVHYAPFIDLALELEESYAVTLYGMFQGGWLLSFCHPVWRVCPDLVPSGWDTPMFVATLPEPNPG